MLNVNQLRDLIVKPVLLDLVAFSEDALELLLFTCAVESVGGTFLKKSKGSALGIFCMRPNTYNHLWQTYIFKKSDILTKLISNFNINQMPPEDRMIYDLRFATAMARIFYMTINETIPNNNDIDAMWDYYTKYYNKDTASSEKE